MRRGSLKRFTAALLCSAMFFTNVGLEQIVYASPATDVGLEEAEIIPEEEAEDTEIPEDAEETAENELPVQDEETGQETTDDPGDPAEYTVPEDAPDDMPEETVPENDSEGIAAMSEWGTEEDNGEWQLEGKCGENVSYSLGTSWEWDEETGESYEIECLKIYGDGEMYDYTSDKEPGESGELNLPPWYGFRDRITQVNIEDNVTSIGNWAFADCMNLNLVNMWNIRKIGASAFSGCMNLNHITVPASEIQERAFEGSGLRSIRIDDYECIICDDASTFPQGIIIFGQEGSTAQAYAAAHENTFYVPDGRCGKENGFPEMPENELYYSMSWDGSSNTGTLHIHSPHEFMIEMGDYSLSEEYPDEPGVSSLPPWYGFRDMIESVIIDSNTPNIGNWAFADCRNLRSVTTRKNIAKIGQGAFFWCENLEKIELSENVAEIQEHAFENTGLLSVEIPNWDCDIYMDEFTFPEHIEIRGYPESTAQKYADKFGRSFTNIFPDYLDYLSGTCGDNVQYIIDMETRTLRISGEGDMHDYIVLGEEPINPDENPDNPETELQPVMEQEPPGYKYRKMIKSVIIEDGVTSIGNGAFVNLGISQIDIPQSVTSIGEYAFWYCRNLETVTLPDGITAIGNNAFNKCNSLINISLPNSLSSIGERAFSQCENLSEISLPESLGSIGSYVFENCYNLTDITIPKKITVIEDGVFYGCSGIRNLSLHDGITCIGNEAFLGCFNWENISIPPYVTSIGRDAFYRCDELKNVTIPKSMTKIESRTFRNCSSLINITLPETITSIGNSAFDYCTSLKEIIIPESVISIGSSAFEDCHSLKEIVIPESVISIGSSAFEDCYNLKKITLPKGITTINRYMFEFCSNLEEITIPEKVANINYGAFGYCSKLKNITIPESVTTIEDRAFYPCNQLTEIKILNPSCTIYGSSSTIDSNAVIHGYESSTAEAYAQKYNKKFIPIDIPRPEKLSSLTAVGDLYQIALSWTISHEIDSTKYRIYRRADDETDFTLLKEIDNRNTLNYTDTQVEVNKTYHYYIVSVNKYSMESEPTDTQSAAAYLDDEPPTVVQITPASGSRVGPSVQLYARAQDTVGVVKTELQFLRMMERHGNACRLPAAISAAILYLPKNTVI